MTIWTVHLPPEGASEAETSERARFIPERGALLALLFPALWLAFARLWFWLAVYLLMIAALAILARVAGSQAFGLISVLPAVWLFLEGRQLQRERLERLGWRFAGVVEAADSEEAELRWFSGLPVGAAPVAPASPLPSFPAMQPAPSAAGIGIFG